jgi:hypothetical protein
MPPVGKSERVWLPIRLKNDNKLNLSLLNNGEIVVESVGEIGGGAEEDDIWTGEDKGKEKAREETASTHQDSRQQKSGNTMVWHKAAELLFALFGSGGGYDGAAGKVGERGASSVCGQKMNVEDCNEKGEMRIKEIKKIVEIWVGEERSGREEGAAFLRCCSRGSDRDWRD